MQDLLAFEEALTSEERLIRDTVQAFVRQDVLPVITDLYENADVSPALNQKCADLGLLGMRVPEVYGGNPSSAVAYGLVCQELERGDSSLRSFLSVQCALTIYPILEFGTEQQKKAFLPKLVKGTQVGCFGLTEPNSGSDPSSMKTQAQKVEGGWVLNGSKLWITNATIADVAIVWAQTEKGVRGFIVENGFKGFSAQIIEKKMSLRASNTGGLNFVDCFVPDSHFLPGTVGLKSALQCLSQARYGIAWGAMGAAMACYEGALEYAMDRHQFNRPIAGFQLVQKDLAMMYTEIIKAQWLNLQIGRLKDLNRDTPEMISLAKGNACREALKIARSARNILGANGISLGYNVVRHMQNLESVFTYEGTDNIHQLILGKHLTGLDAFH